MAIVYVLLSFVALVYAADVDKCAWGESYWCSDLAAAKTCGAINHCKTTVWKNQQVKADQSDVCMFCEAIIADVRKFIVAKATEDEIAKFLSSACDVIPSKSASSQCRQVVEEFTPEVIDVISAELDSQIVCGLLKVCQGVQDTVVHPAPKPHRSGLPQLPHFGTAQDDICADCTKFFTDIKNMIDSNSTEVSLEKFIDQELCSQLGTYEAACNDLVKEFLPEVLQMLAAYYDPKTICTELQFCSGASLQRTRTILLSLRLKKSPLHAAAEKVSSAETCLVCETIMSELRDLDRDKTVQVDIEKVLKAELCSKLGALKETCEVSVELYGPELFELLATVLDPATRCTSLGFCSADQKPAISKPTDKSTTSEQCILCEFVMKEIDSMLANNATAQEIINALDKVCSILPSTVAASCKNFIDTYGPAILIMLEQELDPSVVCTALGLCTSQKVPVIESRDAEECLICETVVQYVEALVDQNSTVAEVEAILEKICSYLPSTMTKQCDDFIEKYGALIVHYIMTAASPKLVCTDIGLCAARTDAALVNLIPAKEAKKGHLIGAKKCTFGPAYWCASRANADECGAVDHCKNYVWKN